MKDPYIDPETGVLINKLGHTDPQALLEVAEHHKAMIEHLRSGNREPYNPNELSDLMRSRLLDYPSQPATGSRETGTAGPETSRIQTPKRTHDLGRD